MRSASTSARLARFSGLTISVYTRDEHNLPHIHVGRGRPRSKGFEDSSVTIMSGEKLDGELSAHDLRLVREWLDVYRSEAMRAWKDFRAHRTPRKIGPFEGKKKQKRYVSVSVSRIYTPLRTRKDHPLILRIEWLRGQYIRAFFSNGIVRDVRLPWLPTAKKAHVVDEGMGLDPGDGLEAASTTIYRMRGRTLRFLSI